VSDRSVLDKIDEACADMRPARTVFHGRGGNFHLVRKELRVLRRKAFAHRSAGMAYAAALREYEAALLRRLQ
jgi:hypothetical protein